MTKIYSLAIETGRHHKPKPIPLEERLCNECDVVEDEFHHLMVCAKFVKPRLELFKCAQDKIEGFNSKSEREKFIAILSTQNKPLLMELATFLTNNV